MQQCSNAPDKEHDYIVTCPGVPESGTGRLDPERQDLVDWLRQVGAFTDQRGDVSRGCWLGMVRQRPRIVVQLKGEYEYAKRQRHIQNPGGWMMDLWKRWKRPND